MRFRKGTTDHDGDGRMGGSMKETSMGRPTKQTEQKRELDAAKIDAATTMDPQTGADMVHDEKPTAKAIEARKAEERERFAQADEKGAATPEEIAATTLSRSIRGW